MFINSFGLGSMFVRETFTSDSKQKAELMIEEVKTALRIICQIYHGWMTRPGLPPYTRYKVYSKTCVKRPLKNRQNKDLNDKINGSLMKVESIAECSPWSILQYF